MQSKRPIWLTLALIMVFGSTVISSLAAPQQGAPKTPPPPQTSITSNDRNAQRTIPGPYRLTYTLTEMDGGKRIDSQRYAIVLDADALPTNLRLGSKVPIATSQAYENPSNQQISYVDIGLDIDARLRQFANGLELRTKVYQTNLDAQQSNIKDPVIRQSTLESSVLLNEDKPVVLGTLDTPGSTRSLQVVVELTRVH